MAKNAQRIRSINGQIQRLNGLMVAAMSGKNVEIVNSKPSLHSKSVPMPSLGKRPILVIKKAKVNLGEEVTRQRVEVSMKTMGFNDDVVVQNSRSGGTRADRINPRSKFDNSFRNRPGTVGSKN